MKKTIVAAAVMTMLLTFAAPALAQQAEGTSGVIGGTATVGPRQPGSQPSSGIPDYEFEDGWVSIGGDIRYECTAFAEDIEEERTPAGDIPAGALDALDGCAEAGLLSASFAASVRASSDDPSGGEKDELPDTGGPDFWMLFAVLGVLLATVVPLARKVAG